MNKNGLVAEVAKRTGLEQGGRRADDRRVDGRDPGVRRQRATASRSSASARSSASGGTSGSLATRASRRPRSSCPPATCPWFIAGQGVQGDGRDQAPPRPPPSANAPARGSERDDPEGPRDLVTAPPPPGRTARAGRSAGSGGPSPRPRSASIAHLGAVVHQQRAVALLEVEVLDRSLRHRAPPGASARCPQPRARDPSAGRPRGCALGVPSESSVRISPGRSRSNDELAALDDGDGEARARPRAPGDGGTSRARTARGSPAAGVAASRLVPDPSAERARTTGAERAERLVERLDGDERQVARQDGERARPRSSFALASTWRIAFGERGLGLGDRRGRPGGPRPRAPPRRARPPRSPTRARRAWRPGRPRASRA